MLLTCDPLGFYDLPLDTLRSSHLVLDLETMAECMYHVSFRSSVSVSSLSMRSMISASPRIACVRGSCVGLCIPKWRGASRTQSRGFTSSMCLKSRKLHMWKHATSHKAHKHSQLWMETRHKSQCSQIYSCLGLRA